MKRIAIISFHTCPLSAQEGKETGGMNVYVYELSKRLEKLGYEIDIFTRDQDINKEKVVALSTHVRVIHLQAGPQENIAKKELISYTDEFVENFFSFVSSEKHIYDILDCHYYLSGVIGKKIIEKLPIPMLITFHTLALMKNMVARSESEKESEERIAIEKDLIKTATRVISPSETDKQYLMYLYNCEPEKIAIVTPGINTSVFHEIPQEEAKTHIGASLTHKLLLFVGRIEPLKGIDVLLYSMKILLEKNPNLPVCLWIVGGDISQRVDLWSEELKKLEELRHTLGIQRAVKFVGRKLPEELPYYYNAAEVAVVPSQYESFGMTALEAMACGTPVITTDVTGVADLFDNTHETLITSANNPLQLAKQLETLLTNEDAYAKASKDVREKVQDLDWSHIADKIQKVYESIIK